MRAFGMHRSRTFVIGCVAGVTIFAGLLIAALSLSASRYGAVAAAVQAAAIVPSIAIAALALTRDTRDKRVDRVLDLHRELHSLELESAKARLTVHLLARGVDGKIRPSSREELKDDPILSGYVLDAGFSPRADADLILRYFERADIARLADSVEAALMVELVGRAAAWWNLALTGRVDEVPRSHLRDLANWANSFAASNQDRYAYLQNWGRNREREFGRLAP